MRRRIDRWIDGDSGIFSDGSRFRLARVRAPERGQRGSSLATRTAAGMTGRSNGLVNVNVVGYSYGRQVVEMSNRDGSINNRLIGLGYRKQGI